MPSSSFLPAPLLVACIALLLGTLHTSAAAPLDRLFESTWEEIDAAPATASAPLPAWLAGSLVRAGLGAFEMGARNFTHAFDCFAKMHVWNLDGRNATAAFSTRFLNSSWFAKSKDASDISPIMALAAVEPDWSLAQKIEGLGAKADNDNVNLVFAGADRAFALSDTKSIFEFTPSSLASVGDVVFNDSFSPDPTFITSMAHPHVYSRVESDGTTREFVVNALGKWAMIPGTVGGYALYRMPLDAASAGGAIVREQFGYLPLSPLCYMHSFALTENYAILVCAPVHFDLLGVMELKPLLKTAQWDSTQPTRIYVFDLESSSPTAGPVFTFEADTFFTLHHINAFETADRRVIFDCLAYANADVLIGPNAFGYLDVMHDPARLAQTTPSDLRRYTLDLAAPPGKRFATFVPIDVRDASGHPRAIETPRTSPAVARSPYCYVYGLSVDAPADATRWSLVKASVCGVASGGVDSPSAGALRSGKVPRDAGAASLVWFRARHMPTEPVFVARPGELAEDDGVVLATVLDGDANESYLIVLDAATMLPIAEVRLADRRGHVVPFSIHGQWRSAA